MALRPIESISGLFDTDEGKLVGIFPTGTNDVSYLPTSEKRVSGDPVAAVVDPLTGRLKFLSGQDLIGLLVSPGRQWVFFGDSITNGSSAANFAYSYTRQAVDAVGQMIARADYIEAGVPGETSAQVLARFVTTLDAYPTIGSVCILIGTNDASQSVAPATYIANVLKMVITAQQRGLPVVVCTVPPRGSSAAAGIHNLVNAYNLLLRLYQKDYGYELAEVNSALVDTATGYLLAAYDSGDNTHPNTLGHIKMGQVVAGAMRRASKGTNVQGLIQSVTPSGAGLITSDPLNARASAASGSWYEWPGGSGSAPTYSMVADSQGVLSAGRWAQMAFDASASGGVRRLATTANSGFVVGDTVLICGRIQIEDIASRWEADVAVGTAGVNVQVVNQSAVGITGANTFGGRSAGVKDASGYFNLGVFAVQFVVPAGATQLIPWVSLTLPTGANVKMRVGEFGLVNVTTLLGSALPDGTLPINI